MLVCVVAKIPCYCADGIVINMVVGGEVVTLKSIEESSDIVFIKCQESAMCLTYLFIRLIKEPQKTFIQLY